MNKDVLFLLKVAMFHCHYGLPQGSTSIKTFEVTSQVPFHLEISLEFRLGEVCWNLTTTSLELFEREKDTKRDYGWCFETDFCSANFTTIHRTVLCVSPIGSKTPKTNGCTFKIPQLEPEIPPFPVHSFCRIQPFMFRAM